MYSSSYYMQMDHHCEWLNNCVGIKNQKYFCLFLFYALIYCVFTLVLECVVFYKWLQLPWSSSVNSKPLALLFIGTQGKIVQPLMLVGHILIIVFGLFFTSFTYEFLKEQYESIKSNQTTVETYQCAAGRPVLPNMIY